VKPAFRMDIRLAKPFDAEGIKSLDEIAKVDPRRQLFIDRSIAAGQCFVAIVDGQVAAYVLNYTFYDRGFVEMLYVEKGHRGRGIGSALMHHAAGRCEMSQLFTSTNQSNVVMQRLLAKLGFERSGIIENLDEGDPELVYVKRLQRDAV
jgi:ribosomal protein S18 acetylase RimI-like enzyme